MVGALMSLSASVQAGELPPEWAARINRGDALLLMRHALAPGIGDPPNFAVDDCATQRNLSPAGQAQAKKIGEDLRAAGIVQAQVLSSPWCRCLDTAAALKLGPVEPIRELGSFFAGRGEASLQTKVVLERLAQRHPGARMVVTHQVNLTALTGVVPVSGELLIVASKDPTQVLFRVKP